MDVRVLRVPVDLLLDLRGQVAPLLAVDHLRGRRHVAERARGAAGLVRVVLVAEAADAQSPGLDARRRRRRRDLRLVNVEPRRGPAAAARRRRRRVLVDALQLVAAQHLERGRRARRRRATAAEPAPQLAHVRLLHADVVRHQILVRDELLVAEIADGRDAKVVEPLGVGLEAQAREQVHELVHVFGLPWVVAARAAYGERGNIIKSHNANLSRTARVHKELRSAQTTSVESGGATRLSSTLAA